MILLNEKGEKPKIVSPKKAEKLLAEGRAITVPKTKDTIQSVPIQNKDKKKKKKEKKPPIQFSKLMVLMSFGIIIVVALSNVVLSFFDKAQIEMGMPLASALGGLVSLSYAGMNSWRDVTSTKAKGYDLNKLKEVQKIMKAMNGEDFDDT